MVILLYHNIVKPGQPKSIYSVDEGNFRQQMHYLKENNYKVLSLQELINLLNASKGIPRESVVITFDDGLSSQLELAYPILQQFGFTACFFVIVEKIGQSLFMDWEQLKLLSLNGMEIGSHGLKHDFFDLATEPDILIELRKSKEALEKNLSKEIMFFSLPRGSLGRGLISDLGKKSGYKALCFSKVGYINSCSSVFALNRFPIRKNDTIDDFIKILKNNPYKIISFKTQELCKDYIKRCLGMANYEYLRRIILRDEYVNERPFPE